MVSTEYCFEDEGGGRGCGGTGTAALFLPRPTHRFVLAKGHAVFPEVVAAQRQGRDYQGREAHAASVSSHQLCTLTYCLT